MSPEAHINGYEPVQYTDFSGGINLRDKADAVGDKEAIDLRDVVFTERGAIRQRDGTTLFNAVALTNRPDSMSPYYSVSGKRYLVLGAGNRLDVLNHLGVLISSQVGLSHGPYNFARFGDPDHEWLFCANGADTIQRYDGTTWDNGTASATVNKAAGSMPRAGAVCVAGAAPGVAAASNANNRLYATAYGTQTNAGPGGTPSNPSRLHFSNQGAPTVWETDGFLEPATPAPTEPYQRGKNWIDFTPGDGEEITACVSWRELVFVFKQTKFFVVWGESTADDKTPELQYREVVNQAGLATPQAIAVGRDGVYFMNRRGVYVTTGSEPQLLSDIISPLWTGDPDVYYSGSPINLDHLELCRAAWDMERFYLAVPTAFGSFNDRLLVYDVQHKWWTIHGLEVAAMCSYRPVNTPSLYLAWATGDQNVARRALGATSDQKTIGATGVPVHGFWRSGWGDYGSPVQKSIRETKVWGQGEAVVSFAVDFNRTQRGQVLAKFGSRGKWPVAHVGTWSDWIAKSNGMWPAGDTVANALVRYARRGTLFSTQFTSSPTAPTWSVHRVASHVRETREPSIR